MDISERRRLCSRCINSTSLQLPRVMKNSGWLYSLVMNIGSEWADVAPAVVDGLLIRVRVVCPHTSTYSFSVSPYFHYFYHF
jgi:hypothetical protein